MTSMAAAAISLLASVFEEKEDKVQLIHFCNLHFINTFEFRLLAEEQFTHSFNAKVHL